MDGAEDGGAGLNATVASLVGWTMCALATASAGVGMWLLANSGSTADRGHSGSPIMAMVFPVFTLVGALIVSRRPGSVMGWLLSIQGLTAALTTNGLGYGYVHVALFGHDAGGLPAGVWVAWFTVFINGLGFGSGPLLLLLFPTGRPPSPRWLPVVWAVVTVAALSGVSAALQPGPLEIFPDVTNPMGFGDLPGVIATALHAVSLRLVLMFWLLAAASVFSRLRTARGVERLQLKWFAYAACVVAAAVSLGIAAPVWLPFFGVDVAALPGWLPVVVNQAWAVAVLTIPVSIGIAILRYRLYDIDLLINRTLVYVGLMAAVVGIYVLVVGYVGLLFQARGDLVSLLAAGLAAVLFQPLRQRLQVDVNRLLYGHRDEPYAVLSQLGQRLESTLASESVLPTIVRSIQDVLKLPYVALAVPSPDGQRIVAETGIPVANSERLDLLYRGGLVGWLLLGPRGRGASFSAADRRLLQDLARQAGIAVHAVGLTAELQRARERLVAAREDERRRLRRDLHDGLGPRLASLGLQLAAMRNQLPPEAAVQSKLASVKAQTQEAVDDVRRLVDGLRPPSLDEFGLIGAIEQHADRCTGIGPGPRVLIEAPSMIAGLSAAVEVAAYRIASEALTNCVRHAHASTCTIQLAVCSGPMPAALEVRVVDDGQGIDCDTRPGTGFVSMRERAEELGGSCAIERDTRGGTVVRARLPLGAHA